jgi:hypothetical protein
VPKITIYQFQVYDIRSDSIIKSKRWGTEKAIREIACGEMLKDTGVEAEESVVQSDIHGFTEIGFDPNPRGDFQTSVRR